MNTTPNINLSTYTSDPNDKFNLMVTFNENMSKIDSAVGNQNQSINLIGQTATTAVSTANTASATASEALQTADSKASINDTTASASTTYSSNKINDLLDGKASINDTTASASTTYSSDKINGLISGIVPDVTTRKILDFINLPFSKNKYTIGASSNTDVTTNNYRNNELSYTTTEDTIIFGHFDFHNDSGNTNINYCSVAYDLADPEAQLANSMFYSNTYSNYVFNTPIRIVPANTTIKLYVKISGIGSYYVKNPKIYIKKISEL